MTALVAPDDSRLADRLRRELSGEVLFDAYSRGRYRLASSAQSEPLGVILPKTEQDVSTAVQIAAEETIPLLLRGSGTASFGPDGGAGLVLDTSKYLTAVLELDPAERRVIVQPGLTLARLNRELRAHGLYFPVLPASAAATLGGMAGVDSNGLRAVRYGRMAQNVRAITAVLADGSTQPFSATTAPAALVQRLRAIAAGVADEPTPRHGPRRGSYHLNALATADGNPAEVLIGSAGTLAAFTRLTLDLQPLPAHSVLGVCRFPSLHAALTCVPQLVPFAPSAVELVDSPLLDHIQALPPHQPTVARFAPGEPAVLLLVEFVGDELAALQQQLRQLEERLAELGGSVLAVVDPALQQAIWAACTAGLHSLPMTISESYTVALAELADHSERLNQVFSQHGIRPLWSGSVAGGGLSVRPLPVPGAAADEPTPHALAEELAALVPALSPRLAHAMTEIKQAFDPRGLFPSGTASQPPQPAEQTVTIKPVLNWSATGGLAGAVGRCNNNGACRKDQPGVMCPSYRVTGDEQHSTRGRANTLQLALSGQLGPGALTSDEMRETLELCVSCKGCKRECPTGVDMARLKIEVMHQYQKRHALRWRERLISELPHYAPLATRVAGLLNQRNRSPWLAALGERVLGLSRRRPLPEWRSDPFDWQEVQTADVYGREVVLWVDTFNTYFEPENARAALKVLQANGCHIRTTVRSDGRPLCCGRTLLAAGRVEEAKREAERLITAFKPFFGRGVPVVGLEPACVFTLHDEIPALLPGLEAEQLRRHTVLLEQFLAVEHSKGRLKATFKPLPQQQALVHSHCHQKAFNTLPELQYALRLIPGLNTEFIDSGCCGMAGAFGYEAEHYDLSMKMAEREVLPAVRTASAETLLVSNGTSCRQQIRDGSGREVLHVARVLAAALAD